MSTMRNQNSDIEGRTVEGYVNTNSQGEKMTGKLIPISIIPMKESVYEMPIHIKGICIQLIC